MENVNTIELNGQLYGIEDTTARTTAEQNSKELVKVKETANSAQTTATTAQTSASTAQTTANEAKAIATTAQTTANEAKEAALTKQPIFGKWAELLPDKNNNIEITIDNIASLFREDKNTFNANDIYYFIIGAEGANTQTEIHIAARVTASAFIQRQGAWSVADFSITSTKPDNLTVHWKKEQFSRAFLMPMGKGKMPETT